MILAGQVTLKPQDLPHPHKHGVVFYGGDRSLIDEVAQLFRRFLKRRSSAIVIATAAHREALTRKLTSEGVDVTAAVKEGRYLCFDAADLLASFMGDGVLNEERFCEVVGEVLKRARAASRQESGQ